MHDHTACLELYRWYNCSNRQCGATRQCMATAHLHCLMSTCWVTSYKKKRSIRCGCYSILRLLTSRSLTLTALALSDNHHDRIHYHQSQLLIHARQTSEDNELRTGRIRCERDVSTSFIGFKKYHSTTCLQDVRTSISPDRKRPESALSA